MARSYVDSLLFERADFFEPSAELSRFSAESPICPLTFGDGHQGWLILDRELGLRMLADPRFSASAERRRQTNGVSPYEKGKPAPPGMFSLMDPPQHTRLRRLLMGQFTVRRMNALEPKITGYATAQLDQLERIGAPAELVENFALPIPSQVICDVLGVPYQDRGRFQELTKKIVDMATPQEERAEAINRINEYITGLVEAKRAEPADDMLSGLISTGELSDDELVGVGRLLLVAGFETTANMIGLGTFALLRHPEQLAALREDPALAANAVEELLRYCTIAAMGLSRTALEEMDFGGVRIAEGQSVAVAGLAANRDPAQFPAADQLDLRRRASGHLAFGYGVHQCLGQQLARAELRLALPALLQRFPGLRLAVPAEQVPMRSDMMVYGVHSLPVSW